MIRKWSALALAAAPALLMAWHNVAGQDLRGTLFAEADRALADAREADAELLAPSAFERGAASYAGAEADLARGRNLERVRTQLAEARSAFTQSAEAAEIASITLASLIKTRADAVNARADSFATAQWDEATGLFRAAMTRLESGDIRGARSRAQEAESLFRDAELTAIKAQYLSQTRALLAQAEQARVPRYAPKTFANAQALLAQAEQELSNNRYDADLPRSLAQQANYEARHAIFLAERIRVMRDEKWTEEDIVLAYEEPLAVVGAAAEKAVRFDASIMSVASELAAYVEELIERTVQGEADRARIAELEEELRALDERLGGVSQERVALIQRIEAEARVREQFDTVEMLFSRDEARVSREGSTLVLRLVGLTFASGRTDIDSSHASLLAKLGQAADVFPRSQIVIEGHTDSYGSDDANMALSRRRAEAVSAYLSERLGVAAFRISAIGYGETRPIANNETPQGRERNRRIEIRIEPQLEYLTGDL